MSKSQTSAASQPLKAGEAPTNVSPKLTFAATMAAASKEIDALLRGGVSCVTFISSALLVGYLSNTGAKIKLSVMRDEFALALKKGGLGGTQTNKYLDYGSKIAAKMFKETGHGMEMAALLAAETPAKAHDAVTGWLVRHTRGKKTEHGYKLDDASVKLNALAVFLGEEDDPNKPELLAPSDADKAVAQTKARKAKAAAIDKDPAILKEVPAEKLVSAISGVISFDVLVTKHVNTMTVVDVIRKERDAIVKAYDARIKALKTPMGKKAVAEAEQSEVSKEAAAA